MGRFGSWTYHGYLVDINERNLNATVTWSDYDENCSYQIINGVSHKNIRYYECCIEPYPDITITLQLAPKAMTFE